MLQQTYTPSNTGIESFIRASADYDLAPVGIGSMQEQAGRLAEFGRNGDIYVVHAAEGETVVPTEVLDANPQVREMLFAQMRDMGLNPDEYVVGSELNSINPDTGLPEFFFKKLFRGVKKIVKMAAPLIVATLGNMILPGIGGLLASAIYTKATGGSWGDVLKGVAMSYLGGAVMGGITGTGTFAEGFSKGLTSPFAAASDISGSFEQGVFGSSGAANVPGASLGAKIFPTYEPAGAAGAAAGAPGAVTTTQLPPPEGFAAGPAAGGGWDPGVEFDVSGGVPGRAVPPAVGQGTVDFPDVPYGQGPGKTLVTSYPDVTGPPVVSSPAPVGSDINLNQTDAQVFKDLNIKNVNPPPPPPPPQGENLFTKYGYKPGPEEGWLESYLSPSRASIQPDPGALGKQVAADIAAYEAGSAEKATAAMKHAFFEKARASAAPNMFTEYGPLALAGGAAAYAGGAFDEPERDPGMSDEEWERKKKEWAKNKLFEENPQDYVISDLDPYKYRPAPNQYANRGGLMERQPRYMTNGGAAQYPRREMLVEGPGTERSDDIPAMLSDGEFVLNSRSVRGADPAGQGNRRRGAQNLYNMMRNFEMRA